MNLVSGSHGVGQNLYHLEWCPKYRYNMFNREGNKKFCGEILREIAERHKIMITEVSVRSDHIHTVVEIPPTMSVLKGTSSRELVNKKPNFRVGYPKDRLWSPGKLYRSVRDIDAETAIQYVRNQRFQ